jgi:hypothetical protein
MTTIKFTRHGLIYQYLCDTSVDLTGEYVPLAEYDAEIATLTEERDAIKRQFELAVSRVVLIERQRDTLLLFVNGKISRAEMEASLREMEGVALK